MPEGDPSSPGNRRSPLIAALAASGVILTAVIWYSVVHRGRTAQSQGALRQVSSSPGNLAATASSRKERQDAASAPAPLYLVVRLLPNADDKTARFLSEITKPRPSKAAPGAHLSDLIRRYYGHYNYELLAQVRAANPKIALNQLPLGGLVLLPAAPRWFPKLTLEHPERLHLTLGQLSAFETGAAGPRTRRAVESANSVPASAWYEPVRYPVTIPSPTRFGVYELKASSPEEAKRQVATLEQMSHGKVPVAEVTTGYHVVPYWAVAGSPAAGCPLSRGGSGWPFQTLPADLSELSPELRNTARVAVLDTGIAENDQRFARVLWQNPQRGGPGVLNRTETPCQNDDHGCNFLTLNSYPEDDCMVPADFNHGTHIAGLISGRLSPAARLLDQHLELMVLKVADDQGRISPGYLADAIIYAQNRGAQIVNMSLTGQGDSNVKQTIELAPTMLFVAAAGNSDTGAGSNLDDAEVSTTGFPATLSEDPLHPLPNVISVAAVDGAGNLCCFSNFGEKDVDVAAPGYDVKSTVSGGSLRSENGTSQATALVSLAAAMLYSMGLREPGKIKERLICSSDFRPSLAPKVLSGGVLNFGKALALSDDWIDLKDGSHLRGTLQRPTEIDLDDRCNEQNALALGTRVKEIILHTREQGTARVLYIQGGRLVACDGVLRLGEVKMLTKQGSRAVSQEKIIDIIPAEPAFRRVVQ